MKKFIKENIKVVVAFIIGILVSTTGVIAATILTSSEVSYNGNKVPGANTVQEAIDTLYTKASSGSDCRNGYQKQIENGSEYSCSRIARQCSGDNCTVCIRAERLHTEICNQTSQYCRNHYSTGATITYGNETTTSGVLTTGDAFDCDVNGDGTYDSNTERFYYVTTKTNGITRDSNIAVLLYYNNTINGEVSTTGSAWYSAAADNSHGPETARDNLPTEAQWSNVQLSQTKRNITNENNAVRVSDFNYEGYAARLLTYQEVNQGCYDGSTPMSSPNALRNKCKFMHENTRYSRSGLVEEVWLETPDSGYSDKAKYVTSYSSYIPRNSTTYTSAGARPVIEVQLSEIEY